MYILFGVINMGYMRVLLIAFSFMASLIEGTGGDASRIDIMIEALRADIEHLQNNNVHLQDHVEDKDAEYLALKREISSLKRKSKSSEDELVFDCHLTGNWEIGKCSGNFCLLHTLIQSQRIDFPPSLQSTPHLKIPGKGAPEEGLWRFTMTAGEVYFPDSGTGNVYLRVDGTIVATSSTNPTDGSDSKITLSLNSI